MNLIETDTLSIFNNKEYNKEYNNIDILSLPLDNGKTLSYDPVRDKVCLYNNNFKDNIYKNNNFKDNTHKKNIEDLEYDIDIDYKKYEYLPITTMVSITKFKESTILDIDRLFMILPIYHIEKQISYMKNNILYTENKKIIYNEKKKNKYKILYPGVDNIIVSMRYRNCTRGLVVSEGNAKSFRNSIIIDMSVMGKMISVKLSNDSISYCGATSHIMVEKAADILIDIITKRIILINKLNNDKEKTSKIFCWLLEKMYIKNVNQCNMLIRPYNLKIPDYIDEEIIYFFLEFIPENIYLSHYIEHINNILSINLNDIKMPIRNSIRTIMLNHSYSLNFRPRRTILNKILKENGFNSRFNSAIEKVVVVIISFDDDIIKNIISEIYKKDPNKIIQVIIRIQKTGSVFHSGPHSYLNGIAYEAFMNIIQYYKPILDFDNPNKYFLDYS